MPLILINMNLTYEIIFTVKQQLCSRHSSLPLYTRTVNEYQNLFRFLDKVMHKIIP